MNVSDRVVLFLGAGASLPPPAGGPLFEAVRDACAKRAGVNVRRWERPSATSPGDPRRILLDAVVPEVFLSLLRSAGYDLAAPLCRAVKGTPGTGPNPVHHLAARILDVGGVVMTTNWDSWVERAYEGVTNGLALVPTVCPIDEPPAADALQYVKLHGSVDRPESLLFTTPQIVLPLERSWHHYVVEACRDRTVVVVGYAGADIDLYPALRDGFGVATASYWFEGVAGREQEDTPAGYERWRFELDDDLTRVDVLPTTGRHLVWCGNGSSLGNPSAAVLAAFGDRTPIESPPSGNAQFAAVDAEVSRAERLGRDGAGQRLLLSALVHERLGQRWRSGFLHLGVLVVGSSTERRKSAKSIANLVLLRAKSTRSLLNSAYQRVSRSPERSEFFRLQAGGVEHDPQAAQELLAQSGPTNIDAALNAASTGRWSGDLRVAETLARRQLAIAQVQDLESRERDWPERVARASFELAQALLWQGRFFETDDVCRTAYMRLTGAKWTSWEFALRGVVRAAHGDYPTALGLFRDAERLLLMEGFRDFTPSVVLGQSACQRLLDDLDGAAAQLARVRNQPRLGPGSLAALLSEDGELAAARGEDPLPAWEALTRSQLPLWKGVGHLRLAEVGHETTDNLAAATAQFERVGSQWGLIRSRALAEGLDEVAVAALAVGLGPASTFVPHNPWLF